MTLGTPLRAKVGVSDNVGCGKIKRTSISLLILVIDDEPDVETPFRQRFRRDLRAGRFTMEFAQSGPPDFSASVMRPVYRSS